MAIIGNNRIAMKHAQLVQVKETGIGSIPGTKAGITVISASRAPLRGSY
jgi:hypothetical protein